MHVSRRLLSFAVVAAASFGGMPSAVAAVDLVAHQAIYKLRMADVASASNFNGLSGAAVSMIERTCAGWKVNEQIVMTMSTVAGGAIDREMTFVAEESLDGRDFKFHSTSSTNGNTEEYKGTARREKNGEGEAEFIVPKPLEMPLPKDTHFYVGSTQWLIELAKSGARTGQMMVFDGTDDGGAQQITAFVLPDKGAHKDLNGDPALLGAKGWEFRLAYFNAGGQSAEPEFEIALRLLENGIITRFNLIFDDMTIVQTLEDVLPAKSEKCG